MTFVLPLRRSSFIHRTDVYGIERQSLINCEIWELKAERDINFVNRKARLSGNCQLFLIVHFAMRII
jgi:hypothetical protein